MLKGRLWNNKCGRTMKKNQYILPMVRIVSVSNEGMLCGSTVQAEVISIGGQGNPGKGR